MTLQAICILMTMYVCVKSLHMGFTGGARGKEPNIGDIRDAGLILDREDALEEGTATHTSLPAWTEEPGKLQAVGSQRVRHT